MLSNAEYFYSHFPYLVNFNIQILKIGLCYLMSLDYSNLAKMFRDFVLFLLQKTLLF